MRKMDGAEFDSLVSFFDGMARTNWLGDIHNQLKDMSPTWMGKEIIDIGCGTGRLLARGINESTRLVGIDLSPQMIVAASELFHQKGASQYSSFVEGDAYELPFSNHEFDIALSTCVMFLLPEPERGLREMIRVTKTNGELIMLNPHVDMSPTKAEEYAQKHQLTGFEKETLLKWSNVSTRRHRYNENELTQMLLKLGVKNVVHKQVLDGLAMITYGVK